MDVPARSIIPATLKTTILAPLASQASRKLPAPLPLRFVTSMIRPPRPPIVSAAAPSAPGKAGSAKAGIVNILLSSTKVKILVWVTRLFILIYSSFYKLI